MALDPRRDFVGPDVLETEETSFPAVTNAGRKDSKVFPHLDSKYINNISPTEIDAPVMAFQELDVEARASPSNLRVSPSNLRISPSNLNKVNSASASGYSNFGGGLEELERQESHSLRGNVTLSWHDLQVDLVFEQGCIGRLRGEPAPTPKPLLKKVSGVVNPGWLVAVMGASGAGKTTLLNALCGRTAGNLQVDGLLSINGAKVSPNDIKGVSAYVQQQDLAFATLTVREHLKFQALLRMDNRLTVEERMHKVEEVITELGLQKCGNTFIGSVTGVRGISGGELKRLSFASEVLMDPPLLFVDEPTSGLDSFMAQSVVTSLQAMAKAGRTILCTIHQPPSEVFAMFNRLLLLAEGRTVYYGRRDDALEYFERMGQPCPANFNPADHYIHRLAIIPQKEDESLARIKKFTDEFERLEAEKGKTQLEITDGKKKDVDLRAARKRHGESRWTQFLLVMWRTWLTTAREPQLTKVRFGQSLFIGLFVGLIFLQVQSGQKSVQNLTGVLFFIVIQMSFGTIFPVVQVFPDEKHIFLRDADNKMYKTWIYMLTKSIAEIPFQLVLPLLTLSVTYFMIGLNPSADRFFLLYVILVITALTAQSLGYLISVSCPSVSVALAVTPPIVIPFMLFGGLFINSEDIPVYFIWLEYISWIKYGFEAAMVNEWSGKTIGGCTSAALSMMEDNSTMLPTNMSTSSPPLVACFPDGESVLEFYSIDEDFLVQNIMILLGLGIAIRLVAYLILELILWRRRRHNH